MSPCRLLVPLAAAVQVLSLVCCLLTAGGGLPLLRGCQAASLKNLGLAKLAAAEGAPATSPDAGTGGGNDVVFVMPPAAGAGAGAPVVTAGEHVEFWFELTCIAGSGTATYQVDFGDLSGFAAGAVDCPCTRRAIGALHTYFPPATSLTAAAGGGGSVYDIVLTVVGPDGMLVDTRATRRTVMVLPRPTSSSDPVPDSIPLPIDAYYYDSLADYFMREFDDGSYLESTLWSLERNLGPCPGLYADLPCDAGLYPYDYCDRLYCAEWDREASDYVYLHYSTDLQSWYDEQYEDAALQQLLEPAARSDPAAQPDSKSQYQSSSDPDLPDDYFLDLDLAMAVALQKQEIAGPQSEGSAGHAGPDTRQPAQVQQQQGKGDDDPLLQQEAILSSSSGGIGGASLRHHHRRRRSLQRRWLYLQERQKQQQQQRRRRALLRSSSADAVVTLRDEGLFAPPPAEIDAQPPREATAADPQRPPYVELSLHSASWGKQAAALAALTGLAAPPPTEYDDSQPPLADDAPLPLPSAPSPPISPYALAAFASLSTSRCTTGKVHFVQSYCLNDSMDDCSGSPEDAPLEVVQCVDSPNYDETTRELAWSVPFVFAMVQPYLHNNGFNGTLYRYPLAPKGTTVGLYELRLSSSTDVRQQVVLELEDGTIVTADKTDLKLSFIDSNDVVKPELDAAGNARYPALPLHAPITHLTVSFAVKYSADGQTGAVQLLYQGPLPSPPPETAPPPSRPPPPLPSPYTPSTLRETPSPSPQPPSPDSSLPTPNSPASAEPPPQPPSPPSPLQPSSPPQPPPTASPTPSPEPAPLPPLQSSSPPAIPPATLPSPQPRPTPAISPEALSSLPPMDPLRGNTSTGTVTLYGHAYDGYLHNCTVFLDLDNDNQLSASEPRTNTVYELSADGASWSGWSLAVPSDLQYGNFTLRVLPSADLAAAGGARSVPAAAVGTAGAGCYDAATLLKLPVGLSAPANCTVVSAVSTLLVHWADLLVQSDSGGGLPYTAAVQQARAEVANALLPSAYNAAVDANGTVAESSASASYGIRLEICTIDAYGALLQDNVTQAMELLRAEQTVMGIVVAVCSYTMARRTDTPYCGPYAFASLAAEMRRRGATAASLPTDVELLRAVVAGTVMAAAAGGGGGATLNAHAADADHVAAAAAALARGLQLQARAAFLESLIVASMVTQDYLSTQLATLGSSADVPPDVYATVAGTETLSTAAAALGQVPGVIRPGYVQRPADFKTTAAASPPPASVVMPYPRQPSDGDAARGGGSRSVARSGLIFGLGIAIPAVVVLVLVGALVEGRRRRRRARFSDFALSPAQSPRKGSISYMSTLVPPGDGLCGVGGSRHGTPGRYDKESLQYDSSNAAEVQSSPPSSAPLAYLPIPPRALAAATLAAMPVLPTMPASPIAPSIAITAGGSDFGNAIEPAHAADIRARPTVSISLDGQEARAADTWARPTVSISLGTGDAGAAAPAVAAAQPLSAVFISSGRAKV